MVNRITEHMDIWTSAQVPKKANGGRGRSINGNGQGIYGIKKLRELILELAVRGKLVPQDPKDEPASVLLEKIAKEKKRLVQEGKVKKQKALPEISDDEKTFELPVGWEWTRLGRISEVTMGQSPPGNTYNDIGDGIPLINGPVEFSPGAFGETIKSKYTTSPTKLCKKDDLLLCVRGSTTGRTNISGFDACIGRGVASIRSKIFSMYLNWFIVSLRESIYSKGTGSTFPSISFDKITELVCPVPPINEQRRIVAKVDELMALCDQLEQQQIDSNDTHQTLVETLLTALTSAADPKAFADTWQRIVDHFDILFTTEQSINQLKQTILQLAVMGKLVPQDPNDEPANILLEKIAKDKNRLVKEGKIKRQKSIPVISDDEMPFELPLGWSFVRLTQICKLITKGSSPKWQGISYSDNPEDILFITSENVGSYTLKLESRKYVQKKFNEVEPRSILKQGDFLMNIVGASIGRTATYHIDDLANINQAVCLIRVFSELIDSEYLLYFFNCEICLSYMFDKQVDNARANLSMGNIAKFVIPIPPLSEQCRIVAKVDELTTICDDLKTRLNENQTIQIQLSDAIVEKAVLPSYS
jgi:type I restriction enzyme, S subunit